MYIVVQAKTIKGLVRIVRRRMRNKWIPQGGIAVVMHDLDYFYFQAMIRTSVKITSGRR